MKISELIERLQQQQDKHGDVDVVLISDDADKRNDVYNVFIEHGTKDAGYPVRVKHDRVVIE